MKIRPSKWAPILMLAVGLVWLPACDSSSGGEVEDIGEFTATVSGDMTANFGSHSSAFGGSRYTIAMGSGTDDALSIRFPTSVRPAAGPYDIVEDNPTASQVEASIWVDPTASFVATSGTVTIQSSTETEISGMVTFAAEGRAATLGQMINVTSTFRAIVQ